MSIRERAGRGHWTSCSTSPRPDAVLPSGAYVPVRGADGKQVAEGDLGKGEQGKTGRTMQIGDGRMPH